MNKKCIKCGNENLIKRGKVATKKRAKKVQRYQCKVCGCLFTSRSFRYEYREKRSDLNKKILSLYVESMPLRAIARHLKCSYNTVVKKFKKISFRAQQTNIQARLNNRTKCKVIQIDEMHTFIGNKHNRSYVALAISGFGKILSFKAGQNRTEILNDLMLDIKTYVDKNTIFFCDQDRKYPYLIDRHYPECDYVDMGYRESDPYLKQLNFVCALVRNRIGRMARKSWCFTRRIDRLQLNLDLLKYSFNRKFYKQSTELKSAA